MQTNKNPTIHCVKVPRVLDWINNSIVIKLKEIVYLDKKRFDDLICCDFCVPCGGLERTILWTTYGISKIGGSICINLKSGCGNSISVFVNGEKQADINEGSSFSASFSHLDSIEVQCYGNNVKADSCHGEFKIMCHFHPNDNGAINSIKDIKDTICFLSDCHGNPIFLNSGCLLTCKELTCSGGRGNVYVNNEHGETILLKRIDLLKQGFVCVQLVNHKGEICLKCVIPFSEVETVVLCAPEGTEINCEVTDVNCRAHVLPSFRNEKNCIEIAIILSICQSIKSVDEAIIELTGTICTPREDFNVSLI